MNIIDRLEPKDVLFVDRTGNLIIFYCNNDIKIQKTCQNIHQASRLLTKYRRKYEGQKVGA